MRTPYNLRVKKEDDLDDAKEKNDKLINMVRKLQKEVRTLQTSNLTLQQAFDKSELFLKDITGDRPLEELLKTVQKGESLKKASKCPECKAALKTIQYGNFHIVSCPGCSYLKKIDGIK